MFLSFFQHFGVALSKKTLFHFSRSHGFFLDFATGCAITKITIAGCAITKITIASGKLAERSKLAESRNEGSWDQAAARGKLVETGKSSAQDATQDATPDATQDDPGTAKSWNFAVPGSFAFRPQLDRVSEASQAREVG